jgi:hypothetical protein
MVSRPGQARDFAILFESVALARVGRMPMATNKITPDTNTPLNLGFVFIVFVSFK